MLISLKDYRDKINKKSHFGSDNLSITDVTLSLLHQELYPEFVIPETPKMKYTMPQIKNDIVSGEIKKLETIIFNLQTDKEVLLKEIEELRDKIKRTRDLTLRPLTFF